MENIIYKTIYGAVVGVLFYLCWNILPKIKQQLVTKGEEKLRQKGWEGAYKKTHKIVKTILYIVLALMIIVPVIFFIIVMFWGANK